MKPVINPIVVIILSLGGYLVSIPCVSAEFYPFIAKYAIYYKDVKFGQGERHLRHLGDFDYQLTSSVSVLLGFGYYKDNSWFKLQNGQLTAQRYRYKSTIIGVSTESSGFFDEEGHVVMDYDDNHVNLTLQHLATDVGAMTIQLQQDLKSGKREFNYRWVFEGKVKIIQLQYLQDDMIDTAFGLLPAIKLKQVTKKNRQSYLWFVPTLDYHLAKIEVYKRGKRWGYLELVDLSFR